MSISGSNLGRRLSLIRSNQSDPLHVSHASIIFRVERCLYLVRILDSAFADTSEPEWTIVPLIIVRYFILCCTLNHSYDMNAIIKYYLYFSVLFVVLLRTYQMVLTIFQIHISPN